MSVDRREFVRIGSAALIAAQLAPVRAFQPPKRKIFFKVNAFGALVVDRPTGTGIPKTAAKAEILFVNHTDHLAPHVLVAGASKSLVLQNADLQIKVNGTPLVNSTISVLNAKEANCPKGFDWESLSCLPQMERVLGKSVNVRTECLDRTNPKGISGRLQIRGGTLRAGIPQLGYNGEQYEFKGSNPAYLRSFSDTIGWELEVDQGPITFEAVPFGSATKPDFVDGPPTGDLIVDVSNPRVVPGVPAVMNGTIEHFAHYYDLVDHTGTFKPNPVEVKTRCSGSTNIFFLPRQLEENKRFKDLRQDFLKKGVVQDDANPIVEAVGGPSDTDGASTNWSAEMRSELNYCVPVAIFQPL